MKQSFKFITFIRNSQYPSSDFFKVIVTIDDSELACKFFSMNGLYVCPEDLAPYVSPRQLARFKAFYNKPRHYDLFVLYVHSYKAVAL